MQPYDHQHVTELIKELESADKISPDQVRAFHTLLKWPEQVDRVCELLKEGKSASSEPDEDRSKYVEALLDFMYASLRSIQEK